MEFHYIVQAAALVSLAISDVKDIFLLGFVVENLNIPERNFYSLDWGAVAIRDCDNNGDLLKFKNVKSFKEYGKTMWITLKLARFRENNQIYGEYICPECPSMKAMLSMCVNVNKQNIQNHLCLHSVQYSTVQYSTVQYSTVQYSTVQYSIV